MASATGMPEHAREDEPLLGRPGDASQEDDGQMYTNFYLGTGVLSQAGIWILVAVVWAGVFSGDAVKNPATKLFSAHPLLNSAGVLMVTQAILVLQPTHTSAQKQTGTYVHATLNGVGLGALIAGLVIIEYNKFDHNGAHFESVHAILGLVTYILLILQALVGITQYWLPSMYGGVDNAKAIYKYHRVGGYVALTMSLATVCAATQTGFNVTTLHIQLWAVIVSSVLVLIGLLPRIKLQKLGIKE